MPTPCCVAPLGGMAVPGTPSLMVRNRSASELPWRFCARVRSGPRPPPRAPNPWQNAQLARNCDSPILAAFASPANGFLSCALSRTATANTNNAPHPNNSGKVRHWNNDLARQKFALSLDMVSPPWIGDVGLRGDGVSFRLRADSRPIYHS